MNLRDFSKVDDVDINKKAISTIRTVTLLMVIVVFSFFIYTFVGQRVTVGGSSMEPLLSDKDMLLVDKFSYIRGEPSRFDVIVFPSKTETDTLIIKRVIGLPGESVQIDENGVIYIDDEILEESYGKEVIENPGMANNPVVLGEDEYFVLGDNRNNSLDSRAEEIGVISKNSIIGKTIIRIFPFDKVGEL